MQHIYAIETINELTKIDPDDTGFLQVAGYHHPGDGGGGMFRWDPKNGRQPDLGMVLKAKAKHGRWIRDYSGAIDVRWFGAKGDGGDATFALQSALTAAKGGGSVYVPSGQYTIKHPLRVHEGTHVYGDGLYSELHYRGPSAGGCLSAEKMDRSQAMGFSRLNVFVHTQGGWGFDLRGISFGRFDHLSVHLRTEKTAGFYGPGDTRSPYYNVFTGCHISGWGDHLTNGCIGFDFKYDKTGRQAANANQVIGGHINTCQIANRIYGTGNIFYGQVLEMVKTGYLLDLPPGRLNDASKGTSNDIIGCYTEYVDDVIEQDHASCFVTAELTMVTGYKQVFRHKSTRNCIVISPHEGKLPQNRSIVDRGITFKRLDEIVK